MGNWLYVQKHDIYGVSWGKVASPVLTRTDDSAGMVAAAGEGSAPVVNDFDTAQVYRDMHEEVDTYGNVFIRIPKCYIRKTDGANSKTWQISRKWRPGFYLPRCFWDFTNSRELPYIDIGKYNASLNAGKLESKSGTYPVVFTNIVNMRAYALANNVGELVGYQQMDIHVVDLLQTLFIVEFATLNSQSVMAGWTAGQYTATHLAVAGENNTNRIIVANASANPYAVGQPISVGTSQGGNQVFYGRVITAIDIYDANNKAITFDGAPVNIAVGNYLYNTGWRSGFSADIAASSGSLINGSNGKSPCMYRGIENPFGSVYQWVDGLNINEYQAWACANAVDYASNVFASPYEQLGYINSSADGYAVAMGYDADRPYVGLPVTSAEDGATTYYGDYYYRAAGQRVAAVGGSWPYGSSAGLFFWFLFYASSSAHVSYGGRLLKKAL